MNNYLFSPTCIVKNTLLILCYLSCGLLPAQTDSNLVIKFSFNEHKITEDHNLISIKPVGVTLTSDRFGNSQSALYLHGNGSSYLNLGTSDLVKLKKGTLSLWVNIQAVVLAGKGFRANPILMTRNSVDDNFNIALGIGYAITNKRLGVQSSKDSIHESTIFARDTAILNVWYHLLTTIDNKEMCFYVNGELQQKINKPFEISYLAEDSVVMGRSMGTKNERFSNAIVDDIRFYHRVLNKKEIDALYHEPNPNRLSNFLLAAFKYILVIIVLIAIIILLLIRNKKNLRKQKEFYELNARIKELEIKVIRTQMNPHFISNCLAAIQNLIFSGQVDKAGEYIAKFSLFLRQVLDYSDKTYVSLEEELTIIKLNIELEQLRFKNEFDFNLEIENAISLQEILIPSLITQPFIENAIWHGLLPLKQRLPKLTVRIYKQNDKIFLIIEDNGVGRNETNSIATKKSRGTKLVTDKIESINKLMNSREYKLEIVDLYDEKNNPAGTRVIIQLSPFGLDEW